MSGRDYREAFQREQHRRLIDGSAVIHTPGASDWFLSEVPSGKWVAWEESATVRDFVRAALGAGYVLTLVDSGEVLARDAWAERWPELNEPGSPGPLPAGPLIQPAAPGDHVALDAISGRDGRAYYIRWATTGQATPGRDGEW